jgi:3-hydroxyacyl-[acyl-carrier-protein] dehydratase
MLLENVYYKQMRRDPAANGPGKAAFEVELKADSPIYRGHFPGHPVCPGICNVELVRECAMQATGSRLRIAAIKKCRFTAVATPEKCPEVHVGLQWTEENGKLRLQATIEHAGTTFVELEETLQKE